MAEPSSRRRSFIGLGIVLIVAGLVAAVAMWIVADVRRGDAIAGFARAPVGCDTTLDFAQAGEYLIFVESAGRVEQIRGDCDVVGAYDVGADVPAVEVTVVDPDGEAVEISDTAEAVDYADDGFVGTAAFELDITDSNDHVIRVESPADAAFAVAIGRNPDDGVFSLRVGALAVGLVGVLLGAGAIIFGSRRSHAEESEAWRPAPVGWTGDGRTPPGPPVYGEPQGPPSRSGPAPVPPPPSGSRTADFAPPPPPAPRPTTEASTTAPPPPRPGPPRIPGEPVWGQTTDRQGHVTDDTVPRPRPPVDPRRDVADEERADRRIPPPPPVPPPPPPDRTGRADRRDGREVDQ